MAASYIITAGRPPAAVVPLASSMQDVVVAWTTLTVHSALDAGGLIAAVAGQLTEAGIGCKVAAAYRLDHLFVRHPRAQLVLLEQSSRT